MAVLEDVGLSSARAILGQVDNGVGIDLASILKGRLDDELAALNVNVGVIDSGFLELAIARTMISTETRVIRLLQGLTQSHPLRPPSAILRSQARQRNRHREACNSCALRQS